MNELVFKNVIVRNFLSVGNIPIKIDFNNGINFVVGWNHSTNSSNGVGKTLLFFNSILFGLFGNSSRNVNKDSLINFVNKSKLEVTLNLNKGKDEILIYRSRKPNDFYYIINGEKYKNDNMSETQRNLNKLLGISEDIFTNIFVINASDMIDFIKDEGSVKLKERFERLFFKDIIFKKILEYARKELKEINIKIDNNENKIKENEKFRGKLENLIIEVKNTKDFESEIEKCKKEIKRYNTELKNINYKDKIHEKNIKLDKIKSKKKLYHDKILERNEKIFKLEEKIKLSKKNIKIISGIDQSCPVCKSEIDNDNKNKLRNIYENEYRKYSGILEKNNENKLVLEKRFDDYVTLEKKINKKIAEIEYKERDEIDAIKSNINKMNLDIVRFEESYCNQSKLETNLNSINEDLKKLNKRNSILVNKKNDIELMAEIFDKNEGILKYFIDKVLVSLNQIIRKFINKMNLDFSFYFDSNLKLKFDLYESISFDNFSGGEKKAINFIVLFSLMEFFFNIIGFKPNFIVIDEIMDTTLSNSKKDVILEILKEFHNDCNIGMYLLSHNYDGIHNGIIEFDSIIELAKKDGFTYIEKIEGIKQ